MWNPLSEPQRAKLDNDFSYHKPFGIQAEIYEEIRKLTELYGITEKLTPQQLWLDKLNALETYLRKNKY